MYVCPICKSTAVTEFVRVTHGWAGVYWRCRDCDAKFLPGAAPPDVYGDGYARGLIADPVVAEYRAAEAAALAAALPELVSVGRGGDTYSLLEVGCGDATFASTLARAGIAVAVNDIASESVNRAILAGCRPYFVGRWENVGAAHGPQFDAGAMVHVVEHFADPVAALRALARRVRPGGLLYIHTPNADHFTSGAWFHVRNAQHLVLFGRRTFEATARTCGLEVLKFAELYGDDLICYLRAL